MDIRLDDPTSIPRGMIPELESQRHTFATAEFLENLIPVDPFCRIAVALESFIRENQLLVYHCTREPADGYFVSRGLRVLDRSAHQAEFLANYGERFSAAEIKDIEAAWAGYFPGAQDESRNGRIWFCLSAYSVANDVGTEYFFEYFGGEAIHMPLEGLPVVTTKLRGIGNPVVVEVRVNPNELQLFGEYPLAFNLLSHYHRLVNPDAHIYSKEGYVRRDVLPREVVRVVPRDTFTKKHHLSHWHSAVG